MSANQEVTSPASCGAAHAKKSVDKLSVKEFRERFYIPNGVSIELSEGEAVSTENAEDNAICFSKEQFNAGLRFPIPSLFKEFLHFTQIPPAYMHPNMVRVLMGCSVLSMLFNLNITLLELARFNQGRCQGPCAGEGHMSGFRDALGQALRPQPIAEVPGQNKRGKLVEWVEKASFDRLNRLFEIAAVERSCEMLLSAQNLRSVMKEPQPYVLNILPRRLPEEVVAGEHFVLQDLPFYAAVQEVDAQTRKARLTDREDKRKEGLLRKAPGGKRSAPSPAGAPAKKKGKEPENPLPPSISSGPGQVAGLNHSGPSLSAAARLAILAEEAASINTPGSPHPDAGAVEAVCADVSPLMATPMKEMGTENQSLPSVGPSLPAIPPDDHPNGSKTETKTETPAVPVVVPDEGMPDKTHPAANEGAPDPEEDLLSNTSSGGDPVDDAACISAGSFSYAELEEKLKQIPPGLTTAMPSAKMFEVVETLVSGLRGMVQQHDLFIDLLRTADYMKAFASQRKDSENQLRLRQEEAEASLSTARRTMRLSRQSEATPDGDSIEKKQIEDLQLRLLVQKEELEGEFAIEREELEADYQKQVDDMFFFGYRCYMKKNGIKRDVPSIPPGEEKKLLDKPAP
ncbi:hypothetical protein CK203_025151 [Vitis vinifera]|uniref:Uncharacterized protein n=1 Tax=Vitis vinifera TaxID=29760 RepID=A0A438JF31_VITVI|nr:hypothetical protein CK203_025151 [Vitis vinifera]